MRWDSILIDEASSDHLVRWNAQEISTAAKVALARAARLAKDGIDQAITKWMAQRSCAPMKVAKPSRCLVWQICSTRDPPGPLHRNAL